MLYQLLPAPHLPVHPPLTSLRSFTPPYASEGGVLPHLTPLDSRLRGNDEGYQLVLESCLACAYDGGCVLLSDP